MLAAIVERVADLRRLYGRIRCAVRRDLLVSDRRREREPHRIAQLPARIRTVGDIGSGCSSDQYQQFNAAAFAGPTYGSIGNESGVNLLNGCWDKTTDLSIARNIRVGGARQIQFRLDLFNAFNAVVFNARTTIQYNTPADPTTIRNNQYNPDGSLNTARLTPANAGAGAATGAQAMRTVQMQFGSRSRSVNDLKIPLVRVVCLRSLC